MKQLLMVLSLIGFAAHAGGGSSIGPAAPEWEYSCTDTSGNLGVLLGSHMSIYHGRGVIAVTTDVPWTQVSDDHVTRRTGAPGSGLTYSGKRLEVHLLTDSAPIYKHGKVYVAAELTDYWRVKYSLEDKKLPLLCEDIRNP